MKLPIRTLTGEETGKQVELQKKVFGIEPHRDAVYLTIKAELANRRQGSASSKNRGEVRGSGVKLWRQKGTGRARVGDSGSPIRRGGGVAFGPKPRDFSLKVNRKVRTLARKSMLSAMQADDRIIVVDQLTLDSHKTKPVVAALGALGLAGKRVMMLAGEPSRQLWLATRNIPRVQTKSASEVSTYDVWSSDYLVIDQAGVKSLNDVLG